MTQNKGFASLALIIIAVLVLGGGYWVWKNQNSTPPSTLPEASPYRSTFGRGEGTSTSPLGGGLEGVKNWKTYRNEKYWFEFKYPPICEEEILPDQSQAIVKSITVFACSGKDATRKDEIVITKLDILPGNNFQNVLIKNTVFDGSGLNPKSFSQFQEVKIGDNVFYKIGTGRFEGTLSYSYYMIHGNIVYDFSLLSQGVDWTNPNLDEDVDSTHIILKQVLETLKFINQ